VCSIDEFYDYLSDVQDVERPIVVAQMICIIWIATIRWKGGFDATASGYTQRKYKP
jgi:hypothetical protein